MRKQDFPADKLFRLELFQDIPKDKAAGILEAGSIKSLQKGEVLFHQGNVANKCFLVLSGRLKLSKLHEEGREAVLRYIGFGELAAVAAVIKENQYPASAKAICVTELVVWNRESWLRLLRQHPQLAVNIVGMAFDRMEEIQQRFLEISAEQTERRIARAILRIMQHTGTRSDKGIVIEMEISREDLADFTGTTHYTVSRILSDWTRKGWVSTTRRQITVLDAHSLILLTEDPSV
jgi:CRP-like cAMP-binding protein